MKKYLMIHTKKMKIMMSCLNIQLMIQMIIEHFEEMHFLRHKKLTNKKGAARGGSNQTGFSDGGIQSNRSKGNQGVQFNKSKGAHAGSSKRSSADGGKFKRVNIRRAAAHTESSGRNSADGLNSIMIAEGAVNSTILGADCEHSERNSANGASHGVNYQLNCASEGSCHSATNWNHEYVQLTYEFLCNSQFNYVAYNPKGLKYPSQLGAILKREYPGTIKVYDEPGNVVKQHPALSWNDYYWKKNRDGICYARRVKQEVAADKILEAYLVRRVSNMVYQLRLEAVKMYFHLRDETCDDTRARTIDLIEEQYLTCRLEWCSKSAWAWSSKYWTSDEYKRKRKPKIRSGTLNTYAVMKSRFKTVDNNGRAAPIPSQKAQKCLDDYRQLVSDENSQELDGKALHIVGNGMKHGRVPIGDGAVDKAIILIHSKSIGFKPINPTDYDRVLKENEQLKETNGILFEENSVNHALIMAMYFDFGREPFAELLRHLESIDARRQQTVASPRGCSHSVDDRRNSENIDETDDDGSSFHEDDEDGDGEDGDDSDYEGNGDGDPDQ
uniref:Uncharacterized protein n=1 Tax=Setaria viridis TaxID=4556 RepID=A0A4U6TXN8_SETVI|nr:hypothetical protein SEVIR_7G328500v2 [Setaria viridis]